MLKRPKIDPRPRIRAAVQTQHWMTAEQVARVAGVRDSVARAELRKMHGADELYRMPGERGRIQYRRKPVK